MLRDHNSLTSALRAYAERTRRSVQVSVVGRVISFDRTTQSITARPVVRELLLEDGEWVAVPSVDIEGVPVLFPGGGLRGMTFDLDADDEVLLIFRSASHDEVDANENTDEVDGTYTPSSLRRMSPADVVAIPGFFRPTVSRPGEHLQDDGEPVIYFPAGEALHIGDSTASKALALAEKVDARLSTIQSKVDSLISGTKLHTHAVSGTLASATTDPEIANLTPIGSLANTECDDALVRS